MVIALLTLDVHFPGARSLKDKRQVLRGLETRLRQRLNVAVAEVAHQDLWQRARLAVVSVNTDQGHLDATLQAALSETDRTHGLELLASHVETM